jgi:hypothetical protein
MTNCNASEPQQTADHQQRIVLEDNESYYGTGPAAHSYSRGKSLLGRQRDTRFDFLNLPKKAQRHTILLFKATEEGTVIVGKAQRHKILLFKATEEGTVIVGKAQRHTF